VAITSFTQVIWFSITATAILDCKMEHTMSLGGVHYKLFAFTVIIGGLDVRLLNAAEQGTQTTRRVYALPHLASPIRISVAKKAVYEAGCRITEYNGADKFVVWRATGYCGGQRSFMSLSADGKLIIAPAL
jgi:hypothetical protein